MSKTSGLTITLNSQNVANNTSNVTVYGYIKCDSGSYRTNKTLNYYISVNGTKVVNVSTTASAKASTTNKMVNWTGNVSHDSSGACVVKAHFDFYGDWVSETTTKTLTAIPQAATITSVTNTTAGSACTCTFTPRNTTYQYKITFSCGNVSFTTPNYITANSTDPISYSYTMEVSKWHPAIPNSKTGTVTATLKTYNGSTQVGSSSSKTFTLTANSNYAPNITGVSYALTNGTGYTYNNVDYYLQNKSTVIITPTNSASSEPTGGATTTYSITFSGTTYTTTSSSVTSNILTSTGTKCATITATDTRGNTSTYTDSTGITVTAYSKPIITGNIYRSDGNGVSSPTLGTCAKIDLTIGCTNIGSNTATTTITYTDGTNTYTWNGSTNPITGISASSKYVFTVSVTDSAGSRTEATYTIPSSFMLLHFNTAGHGMAIGGGNTIDRTVQSYLPMRAKYGITYDNGGGFYNSTANTEGHKINPARLADANLPSTGITGMNHFLATNAMSTGKPATDGHIINCSWDWTDNLSTTGNYDSQLFIPNAQSGHMAFRAQGGRAWSGNNWTTVLDENNWFNYIKTKYVSGDKFEIVDGDSLGLQIPGIVTTSTQLVHVELHMPYSMENVTPSITALKGYIRGISGYLDNTSSTNQNYITSSSVTVTCAKITNYILRINITKTGNGTWSNTTNNTPVSLQANSITINFT